MNKSVLDKLSKFEKNVELAEVKVDLALVDDIQKSLSSLSAELANTKKIALDTENTSKDIVAADQQIQKIASDMGKRINTLWTSGDKQSEKSKKLSNTAFALQKKAEAAADALGVDAMAIKGYKDLMNLVDDLEGWAEQIKVNQNKVNFPEWIKF
jgi:hypothetical protein